MTEKKKNNQSKMVTLPEQNGGVAQVVESLLYQCEALSSNPSLTKNINKRVGLAPLLSCIWLM
jgi:hypothetical protein